MKVDLISDLHLEHWDLNFKCDYECGERKHLPFFENVKIKTNSEVLIVAGDISDDITRSIEFLNQISKYYRKIFFIDGNHEHLVKYPKLYTTAEIDKLIIKNGNKKIVYLGEHCVVWRDTLFIGSNGWWNYSTKREEIIVQDEEEKEFQKNVINRAQKDTIELCKRIDKYRENKKIKQIIVVTHTVPINIFLNKNLADVKYNSWFEIIKCESKINYWLFGHTHEKMIRQDNKNITYISNPRGRPWFNKDKIFSIKTVKIENFRKNIF